MKIYVVIEDGEFKEVLASEVEKNKALENKMKNFVNRDIIECEVEE